jgi:hypothetical protein
MRYLCTIYTHDLSLTGKNGFVGTEPAFNSPLATVVVPGPEMRQAAARAYVRCVGRDRARWLRQEAKAPDEVIAQETCCRAIARSLRKVARRVGVCYEMDNLLQAWSIRVEPAPKSCLRPRRLRLPHPRLYHLSRSSLPN